ncbi:hypothetical protein [Actinoplanes sp. NPDC026670]|uniref:hypothetical protein n=1 Tax=Actinoplanes sp. NPDC026670 TaxID=3154700 RepID=UPI0033C19B7C
MRRMRFRLLRTVRDRLYYRPMPRHLRVRRHWLVRTRKGGIRDTALALGAGILAIGAGPFMVVDGWRQGRFSGTILMIMGVVATLFGGRCLVAITRRMRTRPRTVRRQTVPHAPVWSARDLAWRYAARGDRRDVEDLRSLLRDLSRTGTEGLDALAGLSTCPGLLDGLSFRARRGELAEELQPFVDAVVAEVAPSPEPRLNPTLAAALASLDRDGHTRETAVAAMAADPSPANAWFLAERAADAVEPVRLRALAALERLIIADPRTYAPVVQQAAARLGARRQVAALHALAGPEPARQSLTPCRQCLRGKRCLPVQRERAAADNDRTGRQEAAGPAVAH